MLPVESNIPGLANVGGITTFTTASITRPANTTPYNAGDIIAGISTTYLNYPKASIQGGYITWAKLTATDTGITGDFNIHLFKASSIATYTDNAALAISAAEMKDNYLGYIELTVATVGGVKVAISDDTLRHAFYGGSASEIICVVETVDGFTPSANSTVFTLSLALEQNSEQTNITTPFGRNA